MGLSINTTKLLDAVIATGVGARAVTPERMFMQHAFQAYGKTSAGAGAVAVDVEISLDGVHYFAQRTISLTLSATDTTDGYTTDACWKFVRGNVTSISGTNAQVTLLIGLVI